MKEYRKIKIESIELSCLIGVPEEERKDRQRLELDVELIPKETWDSLDDNINQTIDYAEVTNLVVSEAEGKERKLVETLADDLIELLLSKYELESAKVMIRKFILPNVKFVEITLERKI